MGWLQQRRDRLRGCFKERWRKFYYPYGTKRMFSPRQWEWRDRILVIGELVAVLAALAAIPVELSRWSYGTWLVIGATIIGTVALLWYAFDLISAGEMPLTNRSAHRIRQVISAVEMEKEGAVFDWDNINESGGIPSDLANWSRLRHDIRAIMDRYDVPLLVAFAILDSQRAAAEQVGRSESEQQKV